MTFYFILYCFRESSVVEVESLSFPLSLFYSLSLCLSFSLQWMIPLFLWALSGLTLLQLFVTLINLPGVPTYTHKHTQVCFRCCVTYARTHTSSPSAPTYTMPKSQCSRLPSEHDIKYTLCDVMSTLRFNTNTNIDDESQFFRFYLYIYAT